MAAGPYLLALDQGTTSSRSILFDRDGQCVSIAQREFTQFFPRPGWVEHDALEIWATQSGTIAQVLAQANVQPSDIAAIGVTNQRETTVLWERSSGQPVAPAIVWQDRRTAAACEALRARGEEPEIARRTGLLLDPYFSATKIAWLLDNTPGARARAERGELACGTIDSWLIYQLSKREHHVTDTSNASRTLLVNLETGGWDDALLELFRVPRACLPQIVASQLDSTALRADIQGVAVPIMGIAGDQQAALFGQACLEPGMAKSTFGTGCFLLMNSGPAPLHSQHRLLTTIAWRRANQLTYALEGSVFDAGSVVQWLRDGLQIIANAAEIEPLAAQVADTADVYFVPAFTGLGSPHWDPNARGTLVGLTRGVTRAHVARAALESIAFQNAELLAAMQRDGGHALRELRVDGGAASNNLLLQFQADLLGVPVVRPQNTEVTALGAALLAGRGVGMWSSDAEIGRLWRLERAFEPRMSRDEAQARATRWARAVQSARGWARS
jgi:glycerol kinase